MLRVLPCAKCHFYVLNSFHRLVCRRLLRSFIDLLLLGSLCISLGLGSSILAAKKREWLGCARSWHHTLALDTFHSHWFEEAHDWVRLEIAVVNLHSLTLVCLTVDEALEFPQL